MDKCKAKTQRRERRKTGIRKRVQGTPQKPRLSVYRSQKHIYAQIIDDLEGCTMAAASTVQAKLTKGCGMDADKQVGVDIAAKAKNCGVASVSFDRNGFKYHGRVKALAEAARKSGLKF